MSYRQSAGLFRALSSAGRRCHAGSTLTIRSSQTRRAFWRKRDLVLKDPDEDVLAALVCPFTKEPLTYDQEARELLSPVGVAFPVTANGIPNMIPASARMIAQESSTSEP